MIRYLVLSNLAIGLFYILYKALLQNDTFFAAKRTYLLFALFFSAVFPLIWWAEFCIDAPDTFNGFSALFLNKTTTSTKVTAPILNSETNWIALTYLSCVGLLFLQFLIRLFSIFKIKQKSEKRKLHGYSVYVSRGKITPFTFFSMIFIDEATVENKKTLPLILKHENTHKIQLHSIDSIVAEIARIFFFFNPFVWLLKKEIQFNLECIADNAVKRNSADITTYQYAIVNAGTAKNNLSFINQFNISQLKKRIIMLNKTTSKRTELIKYLSIVPIAAGLLLTSHLSVASNTLPESEILSIINDEKANDNKELTILEWEKTDIDLGKVPQGVPATATYEFVNKGNKPIIITNVKTSCGCTTKEYTKEPILAGQKGVVKATYNAKKLGKFGKTVTVTVNNKPGKIQLRIRGIVVAKK